MRRDARLWVLAVLVLSGCSRRVETSVEAALAPPASAFYPLAVGNRWTYRAKFLGEQRVQEVKILRQEGGFFIDSQGGQLGTDAFGVRDQKRYLLRDPIEPGRTWSNVVSVSSVEHYRILEAAVRCESPAGVFEGCVRVESRNRMDDQTTLVNEFTFAPRVGIVRIQVVAETGGRRIPQTELSLESFQLQNGK